MIYEELLGGRSFIWQYDNFSDSPEDAVDADIIRPGYQIISTSMTTSSLELSIEQDETIYLVSVIQNGNETVRKVFVK